MPNLGHEEGSSASASISMEAMVEAVPVTPWAIRPVRDAVVAGVSILVITWLVIGAISYQSREFLDVEVRAAAVRTARLAAAQAAPAVEEWQRQGTEATPPALVEGLRRALAAPDEGQGTDFSLWCRPLAASRQAELRPVIKGGVRLPATERLMAAFDGVAVLPEIHEGGHGLVVTLLEPVVGTKGVVAVLVADLPVPGLAARRASLLGMALAAAGATGLLAGLIGFLVHRTRHNERALAEQRHLAMKSLQRARDRALAGDKAKTSFLAMMSHELRTPLNGILGMSELLQMGDIEPDAREMCGTIESCGRHLLALVNDLLDFSAIETGRIELRPQPFDPCEPLAGLIDAVAPVCDTKGLELVLAADPGLPARVVGDTDRIRQMLSPLVANAVKFTARGRIELSVSVQDGAIEYLVRDTGPGLPEHLRDRLFRPFQQGEDYLRRQHGGTGLGLAITGRLAERMKAVVTTEVQDGTCFRLRLPLPAAEPPRAWPVPGSVGTARIVYDDPVAKAALQTDVACLGYRVVAAGVVDLLVVDLATWEREGGVAARLVGQAGQVVVLLGLQTMVRDGHRLADFGLIPLRKPFGRQQLAQAILRTSSGMTAVLRAFKG